MMRIKFPIDNEHFTWTRHIKNKMLFYNLSESRIRRVLRSPKRTQIGVAEDTVAAMQSTTTKKNPEEIWVMYRQNHNNHDDNNDKRRGKRKILMISAWRYPGTSKPGEKIPIPEDISEELAKIL